MFKFLSVGAAAAAVILSGASAAFAGTGMDLKFDRHVYHVAACAMGNAPGTARCHARVVTDNKGNFQAKPRSKTASGATFYVPSELRAAYNITGALPIRRPRPIWRPTAPSTASGPARSPAAV